MIKISLQPHEETRRNQIKVWAEIFLKYLKHLNKFTINVNDTELALFRNGDINRNLTQDTILTILEYLQSVGHAEPIDKKRNEWLVYWYTIEDYANMIYEWIQNTGQLHTVCTLYEISSGESTSSLNFHGIDEQVLLKALKYLETKEKCELINIDDSFGCKFF